MTHRDSLPSLAIKPFINQLSLFATQSKRGWNFCKWKPGKKKTFLKCRILFASARAPSFHMQATLSCRDALTNCFLSPVPPVTQDFLLIWKEKRDNWLVLGRKLFHCHGEGHGHHQCHELWCPTTTCSLWAGLYEQVQKQALIPQNITAEHGNSTCFLKERGYKPLKLLKGFKISRLAEVQK